MTSAASTTTDTDASGASEPTQLEKLRAKYPWLDHLIRAAGRYTEKHGDHYAAAITFFSILALVPLLMVAFAAAAFVLANNQALLTEIQDSITAAVPPGLGDLLNSVMRLKRVERLMVQQRDTLDVDTLFAILSDHSNFPRSVCKHADPIHNPDVMTVSSVVVDLTAGEIHVRPGNPCDTATTTVTLGA